jgi:hypothetical protein
MTARTPFTQAGLARAIAAVKKSGLYVVAIRPDGTLVVGSGEPPSPERLLAITQPDDDWSNFKA